MKEENAIEVRNVTKRFKVYYDKGNELKEKALFWKRNRFEDRWVLKGISFDVKKGEAIGLIGHNGCGKSTTLKLLTKIIYPDDGTIEMKGRVSSLIELGAGFHPDMSGRENIYTNAAIFGLTKKEIEERLDDIIAFSELEEFIDNPVRTYSSGMYMRLAFSVAINVDADILLIDEILAVGDANFQAKCFNRLREIKAAGTTIVIVSHSLGQIEQICDRSLWIQDGLIKAEGKPRDVHPEYLNYMGEERQKIAAKEEERQRKLKEKKEEAKKKSTKLKRKTVSTEQQQNKKEEPVESMEQILEQKGRYGKREVEILSVDMLDSNGEKKTTFRTGEAIDIVIKYKKNKDVESVVFGFGIFKNDGIHCYGTNTMVDQIEKLSLQKEGELQIRILENNLLEGEYSLQVGFHSEDGFYYDYIKSVKTFRSYPIYGDIGVARLKHEWKIDDKVYQVDDSNATKVESTVPNTVRVLTKDELEKKKKTCTEHFFTDHAWYEPEVNHEGSNQWSRQNIAKFYVNNKKLDLKLMFASGYPGDDMEVWVCLSDKIIYNDERCTQGDFHITIKKEDLGNEEWLEFTVKTSKLWKPSESSGSFDDRELGVCLCDAMWLYDVNQKLESEGLKVQITPLTEEINRDSMKPIQVQVKNISEKGQIFSSTGDYPVMLVYHVLDLEGNEYIHDGLRTTLPNVLRVGDTETVTLNYDLTGLDEEQYYWLSVTLVQENAEWFNNVDPDNSANIYIR